MMPPPFRSYVLVSLAQIAHNYRNVRTAVGASVEVMAVVKADAYGHGALAVSRALDIAETVHEGSADSNVPMNLGIPAITISGGGSGSGAHSLNETFNTKDSWRGTQRALLLAVALAR